MMNIYFFDTMHGQAELFAHKLMEESKTISNTQFIKQLIHDTKYAQEQQQIVSVGVLCIDGNPVSIATAKAQNRKRGVWGRYCTLTYAYTRWECRQQHFATQLCRRLIDDTQADRVKSLAASKVGLLLHKALNHTFWGLNQDGKCIIDSNLFGKVLPGIPAQVRSSNDHGCISFEDMMEQFASAHPNDFAYRDDPEEYLLNGALDNAHNYIHQTPAQLLSIQAVTFMGEMLRWENRFGSYIKKPTENDLKNLVCFADLSFNYPAAYAGKKGGKLLYRVIVSRKGVHRPIFV